MTVVEELKYMKARAIADEAHRGQVDKAGKDYFEHPMRVAARLTDAKAKVVALLHDTIEDTFITPEYLYEQGFDKEIVDAVLSVTRKENETYMDFIRRAAENPLGKIVKIADLEDNMDITRLEKLTDEDVSRLKRYLKAYKYLTQPEYDEVV